MLEKWHSSRFDWPNLRWPRMESSFFCFYAHFHFHIKCTATHFLPLKFDHKILSPPQKSADTGMASKFCFSRSKANCPAFHAWANDFTHQIKTPPNASGHKTSQACDQVCLKLYSWEVWITMVLIQLSFQFRQDLLATIENASFQLMFCTFFHKINKTNSAKKLFGGNFCTLFSSLFLLKK